MSSSQVSRKRPRIEHEEVEVEEVVEGEEEGKECEEDNSNSQNDNPDNENTTIINEINDDFKSIKVKSSIESNASNISNISSRSSTSSPSSDQRLLEAQRKLEPSIFNVRPHSDFIRYLSDFLYNQLNSENIEHLEIEAKLGVLLDKNNPEKARINLPVECETIISSKESSWIKFESNLTKDQHANFNYILNQRAEQTQNLNYHGSKINYQHLHETDRIYETDRGKIRVTTNEHGKIIEGKIVQKTTIANLNIYSPRTNCDYRISVNIEKPMEMPRGQCVFERKKNRMSYCHQLFKVDLTQVEEAKVC